jgi:uncharacterized protein
MSAAEAFARSRSRRRVTGHLLIGVAAALAIAAATVARAFAAEPQIPPPRGFVNDFAGVIDSGTAHRLDALIGELKAKTGAEIAVVTVDSTKPLTPFDYAMKIAESWKPGTKGKDNGVVFLVAVKDRAMFILTGYGVEGALPDGRVGEIRDRIVVPHFRRGDYAGGIRAGTEAMAGIIAREYHVTLSGAAPLPVPKPVDQGALPFFGALLIMIIVFVVLARSGLWPLLFLGGPGRGGFFGGSFGGGGFGGSGGGFGGFGGGGFGGGGAGGRW